MNKLKVVALNEKSVDEEKRKAQLELECFALQDDILRLFVEITAWPNTSAKKRLLRDALNEMQQIQACWPFQGGC